MGHVASLRFPRAGWPVAVTRWEHEHVFEAVQRRLDERPEKRCYTCYTWYPPTHARVCAMGPKAGDRKAHMAAGRPGTGRREPSGMAGRNRHRAGVGRWVVGAGAWGPLAQRGAPCGPCGGCRGPPGPPAPGSRAVGRPCANLRKVPDGARAGVEPRDRPTRPGGLSGAGTATGPAVCVGRSGWGRRRPGGADRAVWAPVAIPGGGRGPAGGGDSGASQQWRPCVAEGAWGGARCSLKPREAHTWPARCRRCPDAAGSRAGFQVANPDYIACLAVNAQLWHRFWCLGGTHLGNPG